MADQKTKQFTLEAERTGVEIPSITKLLNRKKMEEKQASTQVKLPSSLEVLKSKRPLNSDLSLKDSPELFCEQNILQGCKLSLAPSAPSSDHSLYTTETIFTGNSTAQNASPIEWTQLQIQLQQFLMIHKILSDQGFMEIPPPGESRISVDQERAILRSALNLRRNLYLSLFIHQNNLYILESQQSLFSHLPKFKKDGITLMSAAQKKVAA